MLSSAVRLWRINNAERVRQISKKHYRKNRKAILKRNKRWREENQAYLKRWRADNADRLAAASRKHEYGISQEQFLRMLNSQKKRCLICRRIMRNPFVDHDHKTTVIRGLLCRDCNSILGFAKDSIRILRNAIKYLRTAYGRNYKAPTTKF